MRFRQELMAYRIKLKNSAYVYKKSGQGTVEYVIVFVAFLSIITALGFILNFFQNGAVFQHAIWEASHSLSGIGLSLRDIFLY